MFPTPTACSSQTEVHPQIVTGQPRYVAPTRVRAARRPRGLWARVVASCSSGRLYGHRYRLVLGGWYLFSLFGSRPPTKRAPGSGQDVRLREVQHQSLSRIPHVAVQAGYGLPSNGY
jgi:hypothetical protein